MENLNVILFLDKWLEMGWVVPRRIDDRCSATNFIDHDLMDNKKGVYERKVRRSLGSFENGSFHIAQVIIEGNKRLYDVQS